MHDTTYNNYWGKAIWGDIDGYLDIFFSDLGNGQGSRSEFYLYSYNDNQLISPSANNTIPEQFESGSAAFMDYDNRLDLFIMGNITNVGYVANLYHNKNEIIYPDHNPADWGINPTVNDLNLYNIQVTTIGWILIP